MARNLNIERRRKQIRHYQARRRRRSPIRRAFIFWWGALTVSVMTLWALAETVEGFFRREAVAQRVEARCRPAEAALRIYYIPRPAMEEIKRMGNVRRRPKEMSDEEVGLSLAPVLPEPKPLPQVRFAPLMGEVAEKEAVPLCVLPQMNRPVVLEATRLRFSPDAPLVNVDFRPSVSKLSGMVDRAGVAEFWVTLRADGWPESVLRLAPRGEETPWLRTLRTCLNGTRGQRAAAGRVKVIWTPEKSK